VLIPSCSSRRAHRVMLNVSFSSRRAQCIVSYLPTFLCFRAKSGSSIYRCTLDRMNRTGLSHYAWNPLRVCECDKSICCDVPCLDSHRDHGAMTRVIQMPFALTRQRLVHSDAQDATFFFPDVRLKVQCHGEVRLKARCHGKVRLKVQCHGKVRLNAQCHGALRWEARCCGKLRPG